MVNADSHVVRNQFNTEGPKGPSFVLLTVPQKRAARSRFVGSEHRSCVIFCFDIHFWGQPRTPPSGDNLGLGVLDYHLNPKSLATLSHVLARIQALAVVTDSKQSVAIPTATQPSGQTLSGERQQAVSGNTLDHSAIRAGSQW